jgi:hypothetical protein
LIYKKPFSAAQEFSSRYHALIHHISFKRDKDLIYKTFLQIGGWVALERWVTRGEWVANREMDANLDILQKYEMDDISKGVANTPARQKN